MFNLSPTDEDFEQAADEWREKRLDPVRFWIIEAVASDDPVSEERRRAPPACAAQQTLKPSVALSNDVSFSPPVCDRGGGKHERPLADSVAAQFKS
ncbi:hypothetical protein [Lentzea sp. CC55]|uniref:hypothetical protein n=1 Tax=Lentzea sp. CC55 TaxID=2884909 RepID=UPI001F23A986|nr:hypothetical protein [Lentzea sp. CC55]MCG8928247.1 hypothetical protein [Lentzea sp. CC55]